jgi:hypothetical protein
MVHTSSMAHVKVIFHQGQDPPGMLTCGLLLIKQPKQGSMVRAYFKVNAMEVHSESFDCPDYSQQLTFPGGVVAFMYIQAATGTSHHIFVAIIIQLSEY